MLQYLMLHSSVLQYLMFYYFNIELLTLNLINILLFAIGLLHIALFTFARKIYSSFRNNIWGVDLADMQSLSKYNKRIKYLLCAIV